MNYYNIRNKFCMKYEAEDGVTDYDNRQAFLIRT